MANEIKDFWAANHKASPPSRSDRVFVECPRIKCADGFSMSVQASYSHYCSPRTYVEDGDYLAWEIGYPTAQEDLIMPYAEEAERPTDTVYGFVPTDIINEVIRKHGGIQKVAA